MEFTNISSGEAVSFVETWCEDETNEAMWNIGSRYEINQSIKQDALDWFGGTDAISDYEISFIINGVWSHFISVYELGDDVRRYDPDPQDQ